MPQEVQEAAPPASLEIIPVSYATVEELESNKRDALALVQVPRPQQQNGGRAEDLWFLLKTLGARNFLNKSGLSPPVAEMLSSLMHLSLRSALAAERKYLMLGAPAQRSASQVASPKGLRLPLPPCSAPLSPTTGQPVHPPSVVSSPTASRPPLAASHPEQCTIGTNAGARLGADCAPGSQQACQLQSAQEHPTGPARSVVEAAQGCAINLATAMVNGSTATHHLNGSVALLQAEVTPRNAVSCIVTSHALQAHISAHGCVAQERATAAGAADPGAPASNQAAPATPPRRPSIGERYTPDCIEMGVFTAMGQRASMEDFAFALPLTRPDTAGCWFSVGACFGVFDGHGGHEVAQSLAEHVPQEIRDSIHHIANKGPETVRQILLSHERRLRSDTNLWTSSSRSASTLNYFSTSSCQPLPHSHSTVFESAGSEASVASGGMRRNPYSAGSSLNSSLSWHKLHPTASGGILGSARQGQQWQAVGSPTGAGPGSDRPGSWHATPSCSSPPLTTRQSDTAAFAAATVRVRLEEAANQAAAVPLAMQAARTQAAVAAAEAGEKGPGPQVQVHVQSVAVHQIGHSGMCVDSPRQSPSVKPPLPPHAPRVGRPHPHAHITLLPPDNAAAPQAHIEGQAGTSAATSVGPGAGIGVGTVLASPQAPLPPALIQCSSPTVPTVDIHRLGREAGEQGGARVYIRSETLSPRLRGAAGQAAAEGALQAGHIHAATNGHTAALIELLPPPSGPPSGAEGLKSVQPCARTQLQGDFLLATQEGAFDVPAPLQVPESPQLPPERAQQHPQQPKDVTYVDGVAAASGVEWQGGSSNGQAGMQGVPMASNTDDGGWSSPTSGQRAASNSRGGGGPGGTGMWESWNADEWEKIMQGRDPGSTALVATIFDSAMYVANVGDCRLILGELDTPSNRVLPRAITVDHVPKLHQGEAARLAALRVPVSNDGYVGHGGGFLQVSRSLGDFSTKTQLGAQVILSEPELHTVHLGPSHLFAVAASDGITCAMNDDTIVNQVCKYLNETSPAGKVNDPQHAAEQLVRYAIDAANSADNASVVVTCFKRVTPPLPQRPRLFGSGRGRRDSAPAISVV